MQSGKPQFGQWLLEQIHSGQYEGLYWIDNNKFRIPWKHNSRRDISDEDCKIFKAWAEVSGKIREYPSDKAKWKTNFRCALHSLKKQFRLVEDRSKESDDPHKVYQVLSFEYNYEEPPANNPLVDPSCPLIEDVFIADQLLDMQEEDLLNHLDGLRLNNQQQEDLIWNNHLACNVPAVQDVHPDQPIAVEPQLMGQNGLAAPVLQPYGLGYLGPDHPVLEISILYRGKEVLRTSLSSPRVQLHYRAEDPTLQAHPVCFPGTEQLLDHRQVEYTQRLLDRVQRGLLLEVRAAGVYAVRRDRCRVYASTSPARVSPHPQPAMLRQEETVELLNFDKFHSDLRDFQGNRKKSPEYTIYLCFGEAFPDAKPRETKLITVQVVPLLCRYLHEQAQAGGASSLHSGSISLQISHLNSLDELLASLCSMPSV